MRYEHKGGAVPTTLSAEIAADALVIPLAVSTGWPDGSVGSFWVAINRGALTEEKILCSGRTGLTLQVFSDVGGTGRGMDDTVTHVHPINSPIEHIWTAVEADAANAHIESTSAHGFTAPTAKGDLLVATGAGVLVPLAVGANGLSPVADSSAVSGIRWSNVSDGVSPFLLMGA